MKNFTRRCMTPLQREIITFGSNSTLQLMDEYCTRGSKLQTSYLKHAQCLNQVQKKKEQRVCLRDLQASLDILTGGTNNNKRLQLACCTYKRFESCLGGQFEKQCGKEALQMVNNIIQRVTSKLPNNICRNFKPDSQECRALLPKPGTTPKGTKSNSILSRLLSTYTGV